MLKMEEPGLAPFRHRLPLQLRVLPRLLRRREVLRFRLRAILFRHPRRATLAEVPAPPAEAAVGAAAHPHRAGPAPGDPRPRRPPLPVQRPRRTHLPAARTNRNASKAAPKTGAAFFCLIANLDSCQSGKNHARVAYDRAAIPGHIRGRRILHQLRLLHAQRVQRHKHRHCRPQPAHGDSFVAASVIQPFRI